jgi:hypothetical protein
VHRAINEPGLDRRKRDDASKYEHQHWFFAFGGFIVWMLAWPVAAKYPRQGTLISLLGTIALCVGLILAIR